MLQELLGDFALDNIYKVASALNDDDLSVEIVFDCLIDKVQDGFNVAWVGSREIGAGVLIGFNKGVVVAVKCRQSVVLGIDFSRPL